MGRRIAAAAVWVLAGFVLSGCLGAGNRPWREAEHEPPSETDVLNAQGDADGLSILGGPRSLWSDNETEQLLMDETFMAAACPFDPLGVLNADVGCSWWWFPENMHVLEGSVALRLEVDLSEATLHGNYNVCFWNDVRNTFQAAVSPPTSESRFSWRFELDPMEWDPPWRDHLRHWGCVQIYDEFGIMRGPIHVRMVLERDPDWTPRPRLDRWSMPHVHDIPQEGVITVLHETRRWDQPVVGPWPGPVALTGKIPEEARKVAIGMTWSRHEGCLLTEDCRMHARISAAGRWIGGGDEVVVDTEDHHVIVLDAPDPVYWDTEEYEGSLAWIVPWFEDCTFVCVGPLYGPLDGVRADVKFRVEAWRGDMDLESFVARLLAD